MDAQSRLALLQQQTSLTGIDFVYVHPSQMTLEVHFLVSPADLDVPLIDDLKPEKIRIYSLQNDTNLSPIPVNGLEWPEVNGIPVLRILTKMRGDFTIYKLYIDDDRIDPYYNDVCFSFKANCRSDVDCRKRNPECPSEAQDDVTIEYQARDFWSLRRALLDFASQRYPDWKDRLEADAGVMLAEVMSALGDEFAYYQDRIGREAYLETATQRRSLRRHARLVDYPVHDGLGSSTWLDVQVKQGQKTTVAAGADVWAIADNGEQIDFEIGKGLSETRSVITYDVDALRNEFKPHIWDNDKPCLSPGTTELYIKGSYKKDLPFDDLTPDRLPGKWVLLKTTGTLPRMWMVRLIEVEDKIKNKKIRDRLTGDELTRIKWEDAQALPFEMDMSIMSVHANMVPVTAGKTQEEKFFVGNAPEPVDLPVAEREKIEQAVNRVGPNGRVAYLYSLSGAEAKGLVWRGADWLGSDPQTACPEISIAEVEYDEKEREWPLKEAWTWRRSLLGMPSSLMDDQRFASDPMEKHFTLDDGTWKRVVGFRRDGQEIVHYDFADGRGTTLRFGDQEFGAIPSPGTVFQVMYRVGTGRQTNVPADSITHFDIDDGMFGVFIETVTNPFPVTNGTDPETPEEIRLRAPHVFSELPLRAVRPEDYAEAAERLSWVQRAGAIFRWTGSWLSAFVTPDPLGAVTLSEVQRVELCDQMDRFRQAGREVYVLDPKYADLHLRITICVVPHAYATQVKERVMEALLGKRGIQQQPGFFSPDNFTFGTPLERSVLEARIQETPGVRGVVSTELRRSGWFEWREFTESFYPVGSDEVIRLENDPSKPEHGSLQLIMKGGA